MLSGFFLFQLPTSQQGEMIFHEPKERKMIALVAINLQ